MRNSYNPFHSFEPNVHNLEMRIGSKLHVMNKIIDFLKSLSGGELIFKNKFAKRKVDKLLYAYLQMRHCHSKPPGFSSLRPWFLTVLGSCVCQL